MNDDVTQRKIDRLTKTIGSCRGMRPNPEVLSLHCKFVAGIDIDIDVICGIIENWYDDQEANTTKVIPYGFLKRAYYRYISEHKISNDELETNQYCDLCRCTGSVVALTGINENHQRVYLNTPGPYRNITECAFPCSCSRGSQFLNSRSRQVRDALDMYKVREMHAKRYCFYTGDEVHDFLFKCRKLREQHELKRLQTISQTQPEPMDEFVDTF